MALFVIACLWVLLATIVAFLPMRLQYAPGLILLCLAPILIWLIARDFGPVPAVLGAVAFVSMFRNPLRYFARRTIARSKEPTE
ncbi:MAG: DUF2484 family protein [Pseudomonadota bacterium]